MSDSPQELRPEPSPKWGSSTKLVVALSLAAIVILLLASIRSFLGPLLIAVMLSYLLYPWATRIHNRTRIPWRLTVGLMYLLILAALLSLTAWGGIALIEQIQNLIGFLQSAITGLPDFIIQITSEPLTIGPFSMDWDRLDVGAAAGQVFNLAQLILSQAGSLVGTVASSALSIFSLIILALLLSYFIVSETRTETSRFALQIPGYHEDIRRLSHELSIIWNAFLRGQLIVFVLTTAIYSITMGILGVRYYFGVALLAGFARFVPYIGPFISWTVDALVSFSQGYTIFGLASEYYMLVVLCTAWITDAIIDNLISPRIFSNALRIHPAVVMVCALLAFNLMGVIGFVLAAPVVATIKLFFDYTLRKMLDLDPWEGFTRIPPPAPLDHILIQNGKTIAGWIRKLSERGRMWLNRTGKQRISR